MQDELAMAASVILGSLQSFSAKSRMSAKDHSPDFERSASCAKQSSVVRAASSNLGSEPPNACAATTDIVRL